MFETLKILHFLALLLGGAATIAPGIMMRIVQASGQPPTPAMGRSMRVLGICGLVAIVVLWLTGLAMLRLVHAEADLGLWFTIKLIAATVILVGSAGLNLLAARSAAAGTPPPQSIVKPVSSVIRLSLLIAIIGGVLTFT